MNVEVINTGTELLLGAVVNTHLTYFAQQLFPLGLRIERQVTVPDGDAIREAIEEAFSRSEILLITGGLGPTTDDLTRDITAALFNRPLRVDPEVLATIEKRFADRGLVMTERNKRQAEVPEGALVLANPYGTAPGLYLKVEEGSPNKKGPRHLFLLPGPPRELYPMFENIVIPMLQKILPSESVQKCNTYHLLGMGESNVEAAVGKELLAIPGLELGYCARPGEVDLRCVGTEEALLRADVIIQNNLSSYIVSRDGATIEEVVLKSLIEKGATLGTAESCSGGLLANRITNLPGASSVFMTGYVTYSNEAKIRDLGVSAEVLAEHGAVSEQVARAMAEGVIARTGVTWALSTTGIAGPTGGTDAKPLGTIYIGLARKGGETHVECHRITRDRLAFKQVATSTALNLLRQALLKE